MIPNTFSTVPIEASVSALSGFFLMKSSASITYKRSFNKVDQLFSYVGGLVGTILGFMLFMNKFSLMAFELDMAQRSFRYREDEDSDFSDFNIFTYFGFIFFKVASYFNLCKGWKKMHLI
jgi:hypothetical protein